MDHYPKRTGTVMNSTPNAHPQPDTFFLSQENSSLALTIRRLLLPKRNFLRWMAPCIFKKPPPNDHHAHAHPKPSSTNCHGIGEKSSRRWARLRPSTYSMAIGGDILVESETTVIGPQRLPPPILVPVLGGREGSWFLGSAVPLDHQPLLQLLHKEEKQKEGGPHTPPTYSHPNKKVGVVGKRDKSLHTLSNAWKRVTEGRGRKGPDHPLILRDSDLQNTNQHST